MKKILIILTGVLLVYSEPVFANNEITGIAIARKVTKAKKKTSRKKRIVKKTKKTVKKKTSRQKRTTKRVRYNVGEIQSYAHQLVLEYGWTEQDYQALVLLWYRESSWNPNAINKKSGACGIPQANPCSKATKGTDYRSNWKTQVRWGLKYIKARYNTPSKAWEHSQQKGWY